MTDPAEDTEEVSDRAIEMAAKTMTGDLREAVLELFKHRQKSWQEMSEADQRAAVATVESFCHRAVTMAVGIIAADGRKAISATLKKAVVKDGAIEGTVVLGRYDDQRHALFDAQGSSIIITIADPQAYDGQRAEAVVDPDQGDMLGADQDSADEDVAEDPAEDPAGDPTQDEEIVQDFRTTPDFIKHRGEGAAAFAAGTDPADAPYSVEADEGKAWLCGYYRAEGAAAYAAGDTLDDCPHEDGSDAAVDWLHAWNREMEKDRKAGDPPPIPKNLRRTKSNGATQPAADAA